jgi:ElaB/YqjD/DUF883 family membrane-anchored ribosome-binding protein
MADRKNPGDTEEAKVERSSEDIRQDIAKGEENISQTAARIGELIEDKLDWREYVKDSPYLAIGAAAGLGYLASRMLIARATPMERIMGSVAKEVRGSVGGVLAGAAGSSLILVALQSIATKAAASWIKKAISSDAAGGGARPQPRTGRGSTISPETDTSTTI